MSAKDARMSAMSEILQNMRIILKLQGWELIFLSKIKELRKAEMNWIKKYVYTSAMLMFVFFGAPAFVAMITFGTCIIFGIPLETGKVLSALATFRQLQGPIHSLPDAISSIIQTKVSLDRATESLHVSLQEYARPGRWLRLSTMRNGPRTSKEACLGLVLENSYSYGTAS
jgi:ABC-type multidrug transport system fused ATPase/permease subunit